MSTPDYCSTAWWSLRTDRASMLDVFVKGTTVYPPLFLSQTGVWLVHKCISSGIHTVLDVYCLFASRSHGSVIVSLCARLCRACLCYSCQGQTSRHHRAQPHTDRWVRSIHTLRKCGILQSIINNKLELWRCVHSVFPPFRHALR
jgi:hypothetical protein